jgi:CBS domain-containing protein
MLVAQILKHKGDAVFTVSPGTLVAEAAELLHSRQVGAVVVTGEDDRVVGILSERDVVRLVVQQGAAALQAPVSSCMTADVLFAAPSETVDSLLSRMTDRRIRHLPVCAAERLVGIVSIGDLVKWKIAETEEAAEELKAYIAHG